MKWTRILITSYLEISKISEAKLGILNHLLCHVFESTSNNDMLVNKLALEKDSFRQWISLKSIQPKKTKNKYHFNMLKLKGRPSDFPRRSLNQSGLTPSSSLSAPKNRGLTLGGQLGRQWAAFSFRLFDTKRGNIIAIVTIVYSNISYLYINISHIIFEIPPSMCYLIW